MIGLIGAIVLWAALSYFTVRFFRVRYPILNPSILNRLFFYHLLLAVTYYVYAVYNPSDSFYYYLKVRNDFRGPGWFDFYGTSTTFIEFIGYPFIKFLDFGYEGVMLLFSYFGFLGFCYFYVLVKENIRFNHTLFGYNLLTIILFLPNSHFWTSSFGKGPVIFLGLALYFFGISRLKSRYWAAIVGSFIIYHVRPHIYFVTLIASLAGFLFSARGVSWPLRLAFLVVAGLVLSYIYSDVLKLVGFDDELLVQFGDLSHRAFELTKASSGINIQQYSFWELLFTFLYRPLFFDSQGILGLFASFENLFYLYMTLRLINVRGLTFMVQSSFLVKTAVTSFLLISFTLAQVSGNLGLAMRQKTQVMLFFMFVIISFLDDQKEKDYKRNWVQWRHRVMRQLALRNN